MKEFIPLAVGVVALGLGSILGYYARQSIARKRIGTIEQKLQEKITQAKEQADAIINRAQREEHEHRKRLLEAEQLLLKRESVLDQKFSSYERKEAEFDQKIEKFKALKENLDVLHEDALASLERVARLTKEEAKKELLVNCQREYEREILEKMRRLEAEGREKLQSRAKEIVVQAIQRCALSQAQEATTATVSLPNEEIKGKIIGKEGRNIRTLEKLTGVEIIVDDTPEAVVISSFDPLRRHIAKVALDALIRDGRIQPARIEEIVQRTQDEVASQIKEAGEAAVYDAGIIGLDPKIIQLLGRLRFRTSYGQNVLLHSIEVSHLAGALAGEIGANINVAKKAGLLHDIGKAVDHQIEGSHVDIGMKILEKFAVEKEIITAMKSHHEDYPAESPEATIIQAADQISGARPGARKDTLENYLKRLEELETIATSFAGVEKAWALQAGREIRVFVKSNEVDDLGTQKLAKDIAAKVEEELKYPGEIKVNVIRENRVTEYAR